MAPPTGPRQPLPHSRARAAMHTCRLPTRRHRMVRARSALRCPARIQRQHRMGIRLCSRSSRGWEIPTWLPSVAFHTILRACSPNRINIEHLDISFFFFTTDDFVPCTRSWHVGRSILSDSTVLSLVFCCGCHLCITEM